MILALTGAEEFGLDVTMTYFCCGLAGVVTIWRVAPVGFDPAITIALLTPVCEIPVREESLIHFT